MKRHVFNHILVIVTLLAVSITNCFAQKANFSEMVTFGDSLTHNDLLGLYYGNPQDLYANDPFQCVFNKGASSGNILTNYAIAGSESSDVSLQIDVYEFLKLIGDQGKATLFGFEIGGNDILDNISLLAAYPPGQNADADAVIDSIKNNIKSDLLRLANSHKGVEFIIWTIPDVTYTPDQWYNLNETQKQNVRAHTERVNRMIRGANNKYRNVVVLDVYNELRIYIENPPVLFGYPLVPPPAYGDYDNMFADEIHPTAVTNAYMANAMIVKINAKWGHNIPLFTDAELADLAHISH